MAVFIASTGTAVAASGGSFILGHANAETATAALANSAGTALSLSGGLGKPALAVNNTAKVTRLNADLLDGLDSSKLQRRVSGSCPAGSAIRGVGATGVVTCDDEQAMIVNEDAPIDGASSTTPGVGAAVCKPGFAVVGGGWSAGTTDTPPPSYVSLATPLTYTDSSTGAVAELYLVQLLNPDGTPYTAGGSVEARCAWGFAVDGSQAGAVRRAASRRTDSPLQKRAASLYAKHLG